MQLIRAFVICSLAISTIKCDGLVGGVVGAVGDALTDPTKIISQAFNGASATVTLLELIKNSLGELGKCLSSTGYDDPFLGKVDIDMDTYCSASSPLTLRIIPGVTCCAPMSPAEIKFKYYLFPPNTQITDLSEAEEISWSDKGAGSKLTASCVVFVTHGWIESWGLSSGWIGKVVNGYSNKGCQTIFVDWSEGNKIQYFQASANVRTIGMAIGYSIINWNIIDKARVIGFSLGAQIVGEAGRYVIAQGQMLKHCTGIDPAGPAFDGNDNIRLTASDCEVVQAIHSSGASLLGPASVLLSQLGTAYKSGHCDYWVNCGYIQATCPIGGLNLLNLINQTAATVIGNNLDVAKSVTNVFCSHFRSANTFGSAVNGECDFKTWQCTNCGQGLKTTFECSGDSEGYAYPGDDQCQPGDNKNFILSSGDAEPYCPSQTGPKISSAQPLAQTLLNVFAPPN